MVAYVSQPKLKEKWDQVKVFLMAHRYGFSFEGSTEALSMEQTWRKGRDSKNANILFFTGKNTQLSTRVVNLMLCSYAIMTKSEYPRDWRPIQYTLECFSESYRNSDLFMKHVRMLNADGYTELERVLLEKCHTKHIAHSLHQDEYRAKRKRKETMTSTKKWWSPEQV